MTTPRKPPYRTSYGVKTYAHLDEEKQLKKAKNYTLWVLEKGNKTENEMRTKLRRKQCTEKVIENCITWAKEYNFINDDIYAELYIEQSLRGGKTLQWVKNKLAQKGIPKEITENALHSVGEKTQLLTPQNAEERAMKQGETVLRRLSREADIRKKKQKFFNSMLRVGHTYDEVGKVWNILTSEGEVVPET